MSDTDRELRIKVTTVGEPDGANQVADAIDNATKATQKGAEADREAGKAAEFLGQSKGEIKKLIHELGAEFPIVGMGIRAVLNPIAFTLTSAIGLFGMAKEKLDEWNRELDEATARAAKSYGNMSEAMEEAKRHIEFSSNAITTKLKGIATAQEEITRKTEEATAAIRRQEQAHIAIVNAKEAEDLAKVDVQRKIHAADPSKGIDDVAALKKEAEIKSRYENQRLQLQTAADQAELRQRQNERDQIAMKQHQLAGIVEPLEVSRAKRDAKLLDLPNQISGLEEQRKDKAQEIEKQLGKVNDYDIAFQRLSSLHKSIGFGSDEDVKASAERLKAEQDKLADLNREQAQITSALKQARNEQARLELDKKNYETAKPAYDAATESLKKYTDQVNDFRKIVTENAQSRAEISQIQQRTQLFGTAAGIIDATKDPNARTGNIPGFQAVQTPAQLSAATDKALIEQHAKSAADSATKTTQAVVALSQALISGQGDVVKTIQALTSNVNRLNNEVKTLQSQVRTGFAINRAGYANGLTAGNLLSHFPRLHNTR